MKATKAIDLQQRHVHVHLGRVLALAWIPEEQLPGLVEADEQSNDADDVDDRRDDLRHDLASHLPEF